MASPSMEDLYHKSCALAEDSQEVRDGFQHPARLIKVKRNSSKNILLQRPYPSWWCGFSFHHSLPVIMLNIWRMRCLIPLVDIEFLC